VWTFLGRTPGLRTDGHNVFVYHTLADGSEAMDVEFGVQVTRNVGFVAKCSERHQSRDHSRVK
jgi:hypothetical protein